MHGLIPCNKSFSTIPGSPKAHPSISNGRIFPKWMALFSWDKVCKPKYLGGIGLRDLGKLNSTMGAIIWWRWLKTLAEIWEKLWK
jgi:hypothetical protein